MSTFMMRMGTAQVLAPVIVLFAVTPLSHVTGLSAGDTYLLLLPAYMTLFVLSLAGGVIIEKVWQRLDSVNA